MKREIKILIEDEGPLVDPGHVRVAVTEQDDSYRLHSLSEIHVKAYLAQEGTGFVVGQAVTEFLEARS